MPLHILGALSSIRLVVRLRPALTTFIAAREGQLAEASWVAVGQILTFLGGIIGVKLLTNFMSPESYGELALGLSVAGMVNMFLYGPLGQIVLRFHSISREQGKLDVYFRVLVRLLSQTTTLVLAIGIPSIALIGILFGMVWATLLGVGLGYGIISGLQTSLVSLFTAIRNRRIVSLAQSADVWLRMGFATCFAFWVATMGVWALVGYFLGSLIVLLWLTRAAGPHITRGNNAVQVKVVDASLRVDFMGYGLPFVAYAAFAAVSQYADRWMLQGFRDEAAVGVYAAMYQIASAPVAFLMAIATQLIVPMVFERAGNLNDHSRMRDSRQLLGRSVIGMGAVSIVITLAAYFFGDTLMALMTHSTYVSQAGSFWIIVLALAMFNLAQFMAVYGLSLNRPKEYFWPKFGQALTLVLTGIPLAGLNGVTGMAQALLVSSTFYFLCIWLVNQRLAREFDNNPQVMTEQ